VEPNIRVAWHEGFALAYQVVSDGIGRRDLLYLPGFESNVDMMWQIPSYRAFLERLASLARLITHDRRGLGCSDRLPPDVAPTLDGSRDGMLAVLDAAGSERATILAVQEAVFPALSLAAEHPERVAGLVLFGATPSYTWSEDLPDGWTMERWAEEHRAWAAVTDLSAFLDEHARGIAPSLDGDATGLDELRRLLMATETLGAAVEESRALSRIDLRPLLPSVRCPVLVIRRADDATASPSGGRFLADHVVDGTYVEIPGRDSLPWVGDPDPILQAIDRFMGAED
jgi:pimeloyl-ACP methyl ester carboxylesterase